MLDLNVWFHSSSPRAQGTGGGDFTRHDSRRFIPAGAGNSFHRYTPSIRRAVHPRRRGEQLGPPVGSGCVAGSSPRARGTALDVHRHVEIARFIPAGAGNRPICTLRIIWSAVHPRGRGEQTASRQLLLAGVGSSPRARGTALQPSTRADSARFIPAGAGNRLGMLHQPSSRPVHPRGRGEQCQNLIATKRPRGSSPRARGTAQLDGVFPRNLRFIPAGAGNRLYFSTRRS